MKFKPSQDFYCRVYQYVGEILEESSKKLFSDMYLVVLQGSINIAFVPFFDRDTIQLPSALPDVSEFSSTKEAFLYAVNSHGYTVTPDQNRIDTTESFYQTFEEFSFKRTIFYTSPGEFNLLMDALTRINDMGTLNPAGFKTSQLNEPDLIAFIRQRVIPHMHERDRKQVMPE
ncbi:MAG: hypothetical protein ACFE0Q_09025 [Anaerolineae bacterium]